MTKLVILDRDGVINFDSPEFVKSPEEWQAIPGSLAAIRRLCEYGFTVAVATNQSGVSRGLLTRRVLENIHEKMCRQVQQAGGQIDWIAACLHGPEDECVCRKPKPGLLLQIARHYDVSLAGVVMVGDSLRDAEAANAAGASPVLVRSGKPLPYDCGPDIPVYADLYGAVETIVAKSPVSDQ